MAEGITPKPSLDMISGTIYGTDIGSFAADEMKEITLPHYAKECFVFPVYYGRANTFSCIFRSRNASGLPVIRIQNMTGSPLTNEWALFYLLVF